MKLIKKNTVALLLVVTATLLLLSTSTPLWSKGSDSKYETLYNRFLEDYIRVYELSKKGVNVSSLVSMLKKAHEYIEKGDYSRADSILDNVEKEIDRLESIADNLMYSNIVTRIVYAVLILSIPVLFYILFPRLYLFLWYKTRAKWVVKKHGSTG